MDNYFNQFKDRFKGKTAMLSCGQAGFIIKSKNDKFLGIDLYLSDCVEKDEGHVGFRRLLPKILDPKELCLDILIASHEHKDHFDVDSMESMMENGLTQLYATVNCKEICENSQINPKQVAYIKPGDNYLSDGFELTIVCCDHGTLAPDAVGVVITIDGKNIYFTGDTCLRIDYAKRIVEGKTIDVLIAPINGAYGNMDEEDCVKLSKIIKPKTTVPCHYWMFAAHGGDLWKYINLMNNVGLSYEILPQGYAYEVE